MEQRKLIRRAGPRAWPRRWRWPRRQSRRRRRRVKWRLTSSYKSLDAAGGSGDVHTVAELSDNRFQIRTFAAGEIMPGLQVADAVQNGTVECGQTRLYYYFGKDHDLRAGDGRAVRDEPAADVRLADAWRRAELVREYYRGFGFANYIFGNTGAEWAAGSARRSTPSRT